MGTDTGIESSAVGGSRSGLGVEVVGGVPLLIICCCDELTGLASLFNSEFDCNTFLELVVLVTILCELVGSVSDVFGSMVYASKSGSSFLPLVLLDLLRVSCEII